MTVSPTLLRLAVTALFLFIALPNFLLAQSTTTLAEGIRKGLLEVTAMGTGGYSGECLEVLITNRQAMPLKVVIEPGTMFDNLDEEQQDLIVTAPAEVVLRGGGRIIQAVFAMCTQASNAAPRNQSKFQFNQMAKDGLLALAQTIARHNYQNSTSQSAIWAAMSKSGAGTVFGLDTVQTRNLASVLEREFGIPISNFNFEPRPHRIIHIDASLEFLTDKPIPGASVSLFNAAGEQIRSYLTNRDYERGFHQVRVGASHVGDSSEVFWLRLHKGSEVLQEKQITYGDSIVELKDLRQQAVLSFELPASEQVTIGLYDENNRLHFVLADEKLYEPGFHRTRVLAGTPVLPGHRYSIQAVAAGRVLASQPVNTGIDEGGIQLRRQVQGNWNINLTTSLGRGTVALYSSEGELIRILSSFERLGPGQRNFSYQFDHVEGPDASFTLRLETEDGTVVDEKVIK